MFIVTDVAPYPHGPAGVHGVLPQAAVALSELAGLAVARGGARGTPSPTSSPPRWPAAACWRCSPSARPRGPTHQRAAITDGVRSGRLGILGCPRRHRRVHVVGGVRVARRGPLRRAPLDRDLRHRRRRRHPPEHAPPRRSVALARRGLPVPRPAARRPGPAAGGRGPARHGRVPGRRRPPIGFPLAWCFTEGEGRVFYTSLGHFPGAWETPDYLAAPPRWAGVGPRRRGLRRGLEGDRRR